MEAEEEVSSLNLVYLQSKIPSISAWIQDTITRNTGNAQFIADLHFPRLPNYYSPGLLSLAKVIVIDRVPIPPLSAMGLTDFAKFERTSFDGITYKDTYFVRKDHASHESIHLHELVHVIQWRELGVEAFLLAYAKGLYERGYRNSPLEDMAYRHQQRFQTNLQPYNVESEVAREIQAMKYSV